MDCMAEVLMSEAEGDGSRQALGVDAWAHMEMVGTDP